MAAAHPAQRHYDYGYAPGPSVGAMNSPMRSPSPSSRNQSNYNQPTNLVDNNDNNDMTTLYVQDLRIYFFSCVCLLVKKAANRLLISA